MELSGNQNLDVNILLILAKQRILQNGKWYFSWLSYSRILDCTNLWMTWQHTPWLCKQSRSNTMTPECTRQAPHSPETGQQKCRWNFFKNIIIIIIIINRGSSVRVHAPVVYVWYCMINAWKKVKYYQIQKYVGWNWSCYWPWLIRFCEMSIIQLYDNWGRWKDTYLFFQHSLLSIKQR